MDSNLISSTCTLEGVTCFIPSTFRDHRGFYREVYHKSNYGLDDFVQDDISVSCGAT